MSLVTNDIELTGGVTLGTNSTNGSGPVEGQDNTNFTCSEKLKALTGRRTTFNDARKQFSELIEMIKCNPERYKMITVTQSNEPNDMGNVTHYTHREIKVDLGEEPQRPLLHEERSALALLTREELSTIIDVCKKVNDSLFKDLELQSLTDSSDKTIRESSWLKWQNLLRETDSVMWSFFF